MHSRLTYKKLKKKFKKLLSQSNFKAAINEIKQYPVQQVINILISFLYSTDTIIKQHAITAIGIMVAILADKNIESARIIMRRLMWSLNDESGGIGWGAPEAMAEIMVQNQQLAKEYHKILISYTKPGKNFLENKALQEGVKQGIKRLSGARPKIT